MVAFHSSANRPSAIICTIQSILLIAVLISWNATALAASSPGYTHGEIMRTLAEEKTLGEQGASLLNQYAKDNQALYVQGIMLYAQAKAKFDGLIEQLKADLVDGRRPDKSPGFEEALQRAVEQRKAFLA